MKTFPLIIFGIAALAQWAAPLSQIWTHEQVLAQGTLIRLKCQAPDPYDPLRGRYLAVRPVLREATLPAGLKLQKGMQVYALLTPGADGIATISALSLTPPADGAYIRLRAGYVYSDKASIEWPFDRFYVNEKLAPEADKWFAENIRGDKGITAEVRVLNGRAVLADLSLDGKPFREILKERAK
ncbi:GDYXXLXY domain-containing protein [Prosthecobacter vanneervenii]|uniref:Putative membrane-anchored protein n=1 Tax=Prosthecobacter vanneervenii TaxID=48466 RepID=A0A7W7YEE8_9BACT|nr:GDYXXLXY domain-containing protein [Prosthecobacter vanneervenii]MBB5034661.1 putative membrane-anchored protein [Prosthecobacter vanneervenii]